MTVVAERVKKAGLDAVMVTDILSRRVLNGMRTSAGVLLISAAGECCFFVDDRYSEVSGHQCKKNGYDLVITPGFRVNNFVPYLNEWLKAHNVKRLGFENLTMTVETYRGYGELCAELVPAYDMVSSLMAIKSEEEADQMVEAQRITEAAFQDILGIIRPGMTELEVASELTIALFRHGAEALSFGCMCLSGPTSSMPHGRNSDRKLQAGDALMMDFGAVKHGMHSDMTRTIAIGHASDLFKKVYYTTLEAQKRALEGIEVGMTGHQADALARDYIDSTEFKGRFLHLLGHGAGLKQAESPAVEQGSQQILETGMLFSVEPGIYLPGQFGVRIEDLLYLGPNGKRDLTTATKELIIL